MRQWRKRPKGRAKQTTPQRSKAEQKRREQAAKLRQRLPVKDQHREEMRHRRMMRAHATSHQRFPFSWAMNW